MTEGQRNPFESRRDLPDESLRIRSERLVGFQRRFSRLSGQMHMLADPDGLKAWSIRHHGEREQLTAALADRYPLVIFHGDVGTGKTVTAEAAADALARQLDTEGFLLKLSTRVRGIGHVGEMSTLIGDAFDEAIALAGRRRFVALIIDEGDALAFHRGAERAHHEDKVGVNTLIQKIDDARTLGGRLLIILCTNRFSALDPAILRRAALIDEFGRPDDTERRELLTSTLSGVSITPELIEKLVATTGAHGSRPGFTYSDIQTRLLPAAVARAYPDRALTADDLLGAAAEIDPSPTMSGGVE
jgi:AAA+ superfamily predicted ATPase